MLKIYLRLLYRICGQPVLAIDPDWVEMLRRAGWRPFQFYRCAR